MTSIYRGGVDAAMEQLACQLFIVRPAQSEGIIGFEIFEDF